MTETRTKLGEGGRVVIPAEYRRTLGVGPGDEVILALEDGAVRPTGTGGGCAAAVEGRMEPISRGEKRSQPALRTVYVVSCRRALLRRGNPLRNRYPM